MSSSQNKINLKLDWCTYEAAKYACEKWHYSKTIPINKTVKIGVWENAKFIGAVIFSCGPSPNIYKTFGLKPTEGAELSRVALTKHKTPVTRIIAIALRMLRKKCPKLKLVVSYADQAQNHKGVIYKAGNWIYLGSHGQNMYNVIRKRDNKKIHMRNAREEIARGRATKQDFKWEKAKEKYKFIMVFDEKLKTKILSATSIDSDALADQAKEGGAIPTVVLHA